jgi:hypothetical protein
LLPCSFLLKMFCLLVYCIYRGETWKLLSDSQREFPGTVDSVYISSEPVKSLCLILDSITNSLVTHDCHANTNEQNWTCVNHISIVYWCITRLGIINWRVLQREVCDKL